MYVAFAITATNLAPNTKYVNQKHNPKYHYFSHRSVRHNVTNVHFASGHNYQYFLSTFIAVIWQRLGACSSVPAVRTSPYCPIQTYSTFVRLPYLGFVPDEEGSPSHLSDFTSKIKPELTAGGIDLQIVSFRRYLFSRLPASTGCQITHSNFSLLATRYMSKCSV